MNRSLLDDALLAPDPAAALRARLADGSLDALVPELCDEMDVPQRTHWHSLTVLEHAIETAAAMPAKLELRLAGLFHDIGKRATTSIDPVSGEERYFGHGETGAPMTRAILTRLGYPPETVHRVGNLVAQHMRLHFAMRDAHSAGAIRRVWEALGDDMAAFRALQLADIAAMAPELRDEQTEKALAYHAELDRER